MVLSLTEILQTEIPYFNVWYTYSSWDNQEKSFTASWVVCPTVLFYASRQLMLALHLHCAAREQQGLVLRLDLGRENPRQLKSRNILLQMYGNVGPHPWIHPGSTPLIYDRSIMIILCFCFWSIDRNAQIRLLSLLVLHQLLSWMNMNSYVLNDCWMTLIFILL